MGIRGLTSFIARYSDKYLEDHKLRDCYLVIDGNSFACQLFASSIKFNSAFGGDYDRFAAAVIEFFNVLQKCKVAPLVIFDGGYEKCKLKTTFSRIKKKWAAGKNVTPVSRYGNHVFPCFLKEVIKGVLKELRIPFAQCLFEADVEIAAIARHLKCPVLSYDSDFFVYDVLYIPFPTLNQHPCKDMSAQSTEVIYYLKCSLYRVENFLKRYGGLQKEILPFLSIMLGCDYIGNKIYKRFVSKLKQKACRGSKVRQRRIVNLLEWLQTETLESAKSKVIRCLKKNEQGGLRNEIQRIISMYVEGSSELLPFLGIKVSNPEVEPSGEEEDMIHVLGKQHDMNDCWQGCGDDSDSGESEDRNYTTDSSIDSECESEEELSDFIDEEENEETQTEDTGKQRANITFTWEVRKASGLPEWFLDSFKKGDLPSAFMDMVILNMYFPPPQVEDYDYPSSHVISMPIIAVIYGLIVGCEDVKLLRCHVRKFHSRVHYIELKPVLESSSVTFPALGDLPKLPMSQRLLILLETSGLNSIDQKKVASFPLTWQLCLIAVVFWAKHTEQPKVNSLHIDALLMCLMLLDVVGRNAICLGATKQRKRRKNNLKKVMRSYNDNTPFVVTQSIDDDVSGEISSKTTSADYITLERDNVHVVEDMQDSSNIMVETLEHVNSEECGKVKTILRPWYHIDQELKSRPKLFCISTVHSFAQFQSCLLHFSYLNALLGYPLPHCNSYRVFSGTFVYNIYNNLKQRTNALDYITQLLSKTPSILTLFKVLREDVKNLIPQVPAPFTVRRKRCKKKQKRNVEETKSKSTDIVDQSVDTDFVDPCNRFAALAVKY